MQFSRRQEALSEILQFRMTPSERAFLDALAAHEQCKITDLVRRGLDLLSASFPPTTIANLNAQLQSGAGGSGASDSGSSSSSPRKAKVKAASKGSPAKRTRRTQ